jgi:hypothetical protein
LYDVKSQLLFAESGAGVIPVLTNKEFTKVKKLLPELNFQEFREEKEETGPIVWQIRNKVDKNISIIYGFARENVKTIIINSEGDQQVNRFFVNNDTAGLSVWYATVHKDKVKMPPQISVYDVDGHLISNPNEEAEEQ